MILDILIGWAVEYCSDVVFYYFLQADNSGCYNIYIYIYIYICIKKENKNSSLSINFYLNAVSFVLWKTYETNYYETIVRKGNLNYFYSALMISMWALSFLSND